MAAPIPIVEDLAATLPERTEAMQTALGAWRKRVGAQRPRPNPKAKREN